MSSESAHYKSVDARCHCQPLGLTLYNLIFCYRRVDPYRYEINCVCADTSGRSQGTLRICSFESVDMWSHPRSSRSGPDAGTIQHRGMTSPRVAGYRRDRNTGGAMPPTDYSKGAMPLPADPVAIPVARHQVRRWLTTLLWPAAHLDDIVLAVSEAVTNAVEHAYVNQLPGVIEVRGVVEALTTGLHRATVIVRDYGRWRLAPTHEQDHRGISIMRACMDTVTIGIADDGCPGTRVVLRSKNVLLPVVDLSSQRR
jgi:anti-sigma regulatory factor (Ser/Thr protein kinase)